MTNRVHHLKAWPVYFQEIKEGRLPFSIRDNHGRGFQKGDLVVFEEWDPNTQAFTGEALNARTITYIESAWGVRPGHVVLGFGGEV